MKAECDINNILAHYAKTGLLTPVHQRPGMFVDVSEVGDYRQAIHNIRGAEELFMQLPSVVRGRFENDPGAFLDFASDPANTDEMIEMGLLPRPEEEAPPAPPEVPPVVEEPPVIPPEAP